MVDFHKYEAHVVAARLDGGPFVAHFAAFVTTYDDPLPPKFPNVAWSIDGDAASIEGGAVATDGTVYVGAKRGGPSVLHAFVGPPVDRRIDVPIFAYRSFTIGCARVPMPLALNFTTDGASVAASPAASDLAVRGIACGTPQRQALGIVAATGLTFAPARTLLEFGAVSARTWHEGGPTIAGFATYGTLLARLRDGRTLKFFMAAGNRAFVDAPYAIASPGADFADVAFLARGIAPVSQRLPDRVRVPAATPRPTASDETISRTGSLENHPEGT